ncbi:MAG: dihydrofolate reductase family protein [bacterium]|nr:dihydrofolate reductase family protein [bacterium]
MNRPFIVVQVAASADGRIAIGPNLTMWDEMDDPRTQVPGGREFWDEVASKLDSLHQPQADMLGSNSLVREGEELSPLPPADGDPDILYQDFLPEAVLHRPGGRGWLVVVDGRGRVRSGYTGGDDRPGWHMLHLVTRSVDLSYLAFLRRRGVPYLVSGERHVDLGSAMEKMKTRLRVNCLVTTAGGRLAGALLRAGLVDEVNLILHPRLYGGCSTPCLFDSPDLRPGEWPTRLELIATHAAESGSVWLRYGVTREG